MNRIFTRLGFTAAALVAGSGIVAHAQTATSGSINGIVRDANGAPVAGATIRLSSSQATRTQVTAADGSYRFGLLNPGSWSMTVTKDTFQTFTSTLTVQTNFDQKFNVKIAKQSEATVVVIGTVPTVDVTTTTQGKNMSIDDIKGIPTGRSMNDIAFLAPGVVGSGFGNDPSIGGGSGAENAYILDGLITTDFNKGFQGVSLVTDFVDQVEVQTGGFKPEYSALGGVFNVVTKSGSNNFQGSTWATWDAKGLHAVAKGNDSYQEGPAASRYDVGAEVRGAFIKDKLFYFFGVDVNVAQAGKSLPNQEGFVATDATTKTYQFIGKINYYLSPDQQIIFFYNRNQRKFDQDYNPGTNGPGNLASTLDFHIDNINLTYQWNISPTTMFNGRVGYTNSQTNTDPVSRYATINDRTFYGDATPYFAANSGGGNYDHLNTKTTQFAADVTQYLGNHELKAGVSMLTSKSQQDNDSYGEALPASVLTAFPELAGTVGSFGGAYRTSLGGSGMRITFFNEHDSGKTTQTALYLQDTWQAIPGFRFSFGFRFETQKLEGLNGKKIMDFHSFKDQVQPRLGFVWDVDNDGKTKVSGSYGRYFESIPTRLAIRSFGNEHFLRLYVPNAGGYNAAAPNRVGVLDYGHTLRPTSTYWGYINYADGFTDDPITDNIKLPSRDEVVLGLDHTFESGYSVGIHGRHREMKNPIEDSSITDLNNASLYDKAKGIVDPYGTITGAVGTTNFGAILWNPGPHASFNTAPNSIAYANGIKHISVDTPFPVAKNTYEAIDLTFDKKTERAYLSLSYTWSRLEGNYEGIVSSSNGQADGNITALFDDWNYIGYGLLPLDHTNVIKAFGSYRWTIGPGDFTAGVNVTYTDGTPRTTLGGGTLAAQGYPDPLGYGNATPHNHTYGGDGRNPAILNTDLNLEYNYKTSKFKVAPFAAVFNLFNMRRPLGYDDSITDSAGDLSTLYGKENAWQEGRRYRFGIRVQF